MAEFLEVARVDPVKVDGKESRDLQHRLRSADSCPHTGASLGPGKFVI
jgi:hypothetical protein